MYGVPGIPLLLLPVVFIKNQIILLIENYLQILSWQNCVMGIKMAI